MHITHVIAGLGRDGGGTAGYVAGLIQAQCAQAEMEVSLLAAPLGGEQIHLPESCDRPDIPIYGRLQSFIRRPFSKSIRSLHASKPIDILHCHGLWLSCNHEAVVAAKSLGIPVLLATHGMLQPEALKVSRAKKRLAGYLYQWKDLKRAEFLMVTANNEAAAIRALGFSQPVVISPPGINLPKQNDLAKFAQDAPKRRALLLTRITPIKNIEALLLAWSRMHTDGWELIIAGPDERGYAAHIAETIKKLRLSQSVTLQGAVFGDEKAVLFQESSLFILPSLSENFGIVVAEALSYGLPVLTTTGTPWQSLAAHQCGWWVDPDEISLRAALQPILNLNNSVLAQMGARGRKFVEEHYEWCSVNSQLCRAYSWILGQGDPPSSINFSNGR